MVLRLLPVAFLLLSAPLVFAHQTTDDEAYTERTSDVVLPQRSAEERSEDCFSAHADSTIRRMLKPQKYKMPDGHVVQETQASIDEMHQLIWSHKDTIDPRLVYYRMFGESDANPFQPNLAGSGAYGLFQFLGHFYKQASHKSQILARYKMYPNKSPRLIQLEYYYDTYIETLKKNTDKGQGGCHPTKWAKLTAVQKVAYLGWGNCKKAAIRAEYRLCPGNAGYKPDACLVGGSLVAGKPVKPLCDEP